MTMREELHIWLSLVGLSLKSGLEYRAAFFVQMLAMILNYAAMYAEIWIITERFNSLGGWTWQELTVLLAFQLFSYALGAAFSMGQFRELGALVRTGDFDLILTRPVNSCAFLIFSGVNVNYAGHFVLAISLMIWALLQPEIPVSVPSILYLFCAAISGALVVVSIFIILGALALNLIDGNFLTNIFFSFWHMTRYPLNIFPHYIQFTLTAIVPMAFFSYIPVAVFIGKPIFLLGDAAPIISILAGPALMLGSLTIWSFCLRRYQSAGG